MIMIQEKAHEEIKGIANDLDDINTVFSNMIDELSYPIDTIKIPGNEDLINRFVEIIELITKTRLDILDNKYKLFKVTEDNYDENSKTFYYKISMVPDDNGMKVIYVKSNIDTGQDYIYDYSQDISNTNPGVKLVLSMIKGGIISSSNSYYISAIRKISRDQYISKYDFHANHASEPKFFKCVEDMKEGI